MVFSHDRLVVYQHAIEFVAWSHKLINGVDAVGSVRTQLERAATRIPLNLAEGNVKSSPRVRRRYSEIALGSTVECAAILDVLVARALRSSADVSRGKDAHRENRVNAGQARAKYRRPGRQGGWTTTGQDRGRRQRLRG